jgi:UTP:GlnB (protein PII) uridylyltransferase
VCQLTATHERNADRHADNPDNTRVRMDSSGIQAREFSSALDMSWSKIAETLRRLGLRSSVRDDRRARARRQGGRKGAAAQSSEARAAQPQGRHCAARRVRFREIVAEDRPGLLYDLATAITANGGNIEVVLIDTQAHKAIDVFYVTADGGKLNEEKQSAIRGAVETAAGVAKPSEPRP